MSTRSRVTLGQVSSADLVYPSVGQILRTEKTHVKSPFGFDFELLSEVFEFVKGKTS